jgi:hypothetical protein
MSRIIQLCIFFIAFTTFFVSCKNETTFFEVKGNIANAAGKKVSLQWLTFGAKAPIVLAEDTIKPNGLFIVRTPKNEAQDIYLLKIENGPEFYLVNDVESISVKADVENYKQYTTENSTASTQLHNFLNDYSKQYPLVKEAIFINDSISKAVVTDSIKNIYQQQKNTAVSNLNSIIKSYSSNNTYPVIEAYLIAKAMATMPAYEVRTLLNNANKKFPNNQHLKVLNVLLQQANAATKKQQNIVVDTVQKDTSKRLQKDTLQKPAATDTAKKSIPKTTTNKK